MRWTRLRSIQPLAKTALQMPLRAPLTSTRARAALRRPCSSPCSRTCAPGSCMHSSPGRCRLPGASPGCAGGSGAGRSRRAHAGDTVACMRSCLKSALSEQWRHASAAPQAACAARQGLACRPAAEDLDWEDVPEHQPQPPASQCDAGRPTAGEPRGPGPLPRQGARPALPPGCLFPSTDGLVRRWTACLAHGHDPASGWPKAQGSRALSRQLQAGTCLGRAGSAHERTRVCRCRRRPLLPGRGDYG